LEPAQVITKYEKSLLATLQELGEMEMRKYSKTANIPVWAKKIWAV
jgi:hypothetical protein